MPAQTTPTTKPGAPLSPAQILQRNRDNARRMAEQVGVAKVQKLLKRAATELEASLRKQTGGDDTFTVMRLHVTMAQVKDVLASLKKGMKGAIVEHGKDAAAQAAQGTVQYLEAAEKRFRGINQVLGIDNARVVDRAVAGTESSILARIAADPNHPGHRGVLDRYEDNVVQNFEETLQQRLVQRAPWEDVRDQLTASSPFLQGAPAHWAERIARTESMNASNRANWETIREADKELGDMAKILSCTDDSRTGADSLSCHGEIRKPEEAFESWNGMFQHPPDRPNDRATVVPHRIAWPIPAGLKPYSDAAVTARWMKEGRKGAPPGRPKMTTIPLARFGHDEEHGPVESKEAREARTAPQPAPQPQAQSKPQPDAQSAAQGQPVAATPLPVRPGLPGRRRRAIEQILNLPNIGTAFAPRIESPLPPIPATAPVMPSSVQQAVLDRRLRDISNGNARAESQVRIGNVTSDYRELHPGDVRGYVNALSRPRTEMQPEPPVVVRLGGTLQAYDERSAHVLAAHHYFASSMVRAHVVDLDQAEQDAARADAQAARDQARAAREAARQAKFAAKQPAPAPVAGGPKTAAKQVHVEFVSPDEAQKDWIKGAGPWTSPSSSSEIRKVFGDKVPTIASLERIWGHEDSGMTIKLKDVSAEYGSVRASGDIIRNGKRIGEITRSFHRHRDGTLEVHHDYFVINDEKERGGGGGEAMLRQSIQSYEKMGVHEVTTDPHWIGRYTWGTFGYQWDKSRAHSVEQELRGFMMRNGIEAQRASTIAKQVAPYPWDVAALDLDGIMVHTDYNAGPGVGMQKGTFKMGKAFMLGPMPPWNGKIDLRDKNSDSYQRAKKRLGL